MPTVDEIITIWKQQGVEKFRADLMSVGFYAGAAEQKLASVRKVLGSTTWSNSSRRMDSLTVGLANAGFAANKLEQGLAGSVSQLKQIKLPNLGNTRSSSGNGVASGIQHISTNSRQASVGVMDLNQNLAQLVGFTGGVFALREGVRFIIQATGDVQRAQVAFSQLTGSAQAGQQMVADLQKFSVKTPYNFTTALSSAQQLLAMGTSTKELIPVMTNLGDAVASVGGGSDVFARLAYNLGQIRAQGKAYAVDIRQFAQAGIDIYGVMEAATGKKLTRDQLTEMDGEEFIKNFNLGVEKKFGGLMDKMAGTLPQSLSNTMDAFTQLGATIGQSVAPEITGLLHGVNDLIFGLNKLAQESPGATKALTVIGGGAAVAGTLGIGKSIFQRKSLTKAIIEDIAAERTKIGVAAKEGAALQTVGNIAEGAAASKMKLKSATELEALAAANSASLWTRAGLAVSRAKGWMGSAYEFGGTSFQSPFAGAFGGRMIGGQMFARGGARTMGLVTNAGVATGAMLGAGAGFQSYDNWRAVGDSVGEAAAKATATGVTAGLVATFVPGGAIAVAAGEAIAWGINKYVNEPMEKAAVSDDPLGVTPETKGMSPEQRADYYRQKGREELLRKPTIWERISNSNFVRDGAPGSYGNPKSDDYFRRARLIEQAERHRRSRSELMAEEKRTAEQRAKFEEEARQQAFEERLNRPSSDYSAGPQAHKSRNSDWIIRLPASPADKSYDRRRYNRVTPMPNLGRV